MPMHKIEERGHARDRGIVVFDNAEFWRRARLSPSYTLPRGVVFRHELNLMGELVSPVCLAGVQKSIHVTWPTFSQH